MMRKKIVSLCTALVLCLGLLPTTALAADNDKPNNLYVGTTIIAITPYDDNAAYWTSDDGITWTSQTDKPTADSYIHYDGNGTLTLHNVSIQGDYTDHTLGYGIYAMSSSGPVSLSIVLEEKNNVSGVYGINVSSDGGYASLNISGPGSLTVSSPNYNGIGIFMSSKTSDANLTIEGASVTASGNQSGGSGVRLITSQTGSPSLTIEVKGGNLQASGATNGIHFLSNANDATAVANLKVSGNAMVKASSISTTKDGTGSAPELKPATSGSDGTGGIIWDGKNGTVYGNVTLQKDLTIGEGETLTIPEGASLDTNGKTITVESGGKLEGEPTGSGTVKIAPTITTESLPGGTVGEPYTETILAATGDASITWSVSNGSLPAGLSLSENGKIIGTPTVDGTFNFTVKATNTGGSDSKSLSITIGAQTNVPVTGVSLNTSTLNLIEGGTGTLIATVEPSNATNRNVTWSSDNPSVATVNNGVVSAVSEGTATITVAAQSDNTKSAACTVTVTRPYIPPANPNYRITVEATQGGTVTADPTAAKAGTTVTLTPVPDRGYQVGAVAVTDRFGDAVAVTEQADGTYTFVMPNGQVTVTVTFEQAPLPFHDVTEGDWFYDAVRYAYENSLMDGVGAGLFAPNSDTTRAQLVTILYRLAGEPEPGEDSGFSDVESGTWYTDAVLWAAQNGIVNGVSETEFAPGEDITREQLATILFRYAESAGYDVSAQADLSGFPDAGDIQSYATQALSWAVAEGLLQGFEDDSLQPGGTATRAQIATLLMRFLAAAPTA